MPDERPYLTPDDVAGMLQIGNREAVLRLLRAGDLPGFKVGRRWRVDPADFASWIERRKAIPSDPTRIEPRSARSQAALGRRRRTA